MNQMFLLSADLKSTDKAQMPNDHAPPLVYMIAGEPSGDVLGGRLMEALSEATGGQIRFSGVGGPEMTDQGLDSLFPMSDLSVMGIAEVLPKIPHLLRRISEVVKEVKACKPDVVITIDAPDFSFRVAKRLKGKGIPLVHYVAPTVWAWRPGRAAKIAKFLDHLLCLFPFEPAYFEKEGLTATFVGHSVIESTAVGADGQTFRAQYGIADDIPLLAVLAGSRVGEVTRHLPVFRDTIEQLYTNFPNLQIVSVTTGPVAEMVKQEMATWSVPSLIIDKSSEKYAAMAAANVALAASGTITLELAVVGTPSVVAYQVNPITAWIGKRLVKAKFASLINILLDKEIMPERLIENCKAEVLTSEITQLLTNKTAQETQTTAFSKAIAMLSPSPEQTPSQKSAETILNIINRTNT